MPLAGKRLAMACRLPPSLTAIIPRAEGHRAEPRDYRSQAFPTRCESNHSPRPAVTESDSTAANNSAMPRTRSAKCSPTFLMARARRCRSKTAPSRSIWRSRNTQFPASTTNACCISGRTSEMSCGGCSLVTSDLESLDERLRAEPLYAQVPAFAAADRAMIDVLATTREGVTRGDRTEGR